MNETMRKRQYVRPRAEVLGMDEDGCQLLAVSDRSGQFEDMNNGGDLGGDSAGGGGFEDMEYGGDLGGTVTGN